MSSGAKQSTKPLCLGVRDSKLNRLLALRGEGMHSQGLSFRGSVTQRPDFERLDSLPPPNYADSLIKKNGSMPPKQKAFYIN